jgi:hypothetical protein
MTKKTAEPVVEERITFDDVVGVMQTASRKVKNPKKALQEEGLEEIRAINEKFKSQKLEPHPSWKK